MRENEGSSSMSQTPEVAFRRVCQVAAIAESSRLEGTLDWLIQVLMYYYDGPWRSADDWFEAVQETFSMDLGLHDINQSLDRLTTGRQLTRDSYLNRYQLSEPARQVVESRLQEAADLEQRVGSRWRESVSELIAPELATTAWRVLLEYAARVFRIHGTEAIDLLCKQADELSTANEGNTKQLVDILQRETIDSRSVLTSFKLYRNFLLRPTRKP